MMATKASKTEIAQLMRIILDRALIEGLCDDDEQLLRDIVAPVWRAKNGDKPFYVTVSPGRVIQARGRDGSWPQPISWRKALGLLTSRGKVLAVARRLANSGGIKDFSNPCSSCGRPFTEADQGKGMTHWDHYPYSFKYIFAKFVDNIGISSEDQVMLTDNGNDFYYPEVAEWWMDFHERHAQFRLLHARCNLLDRERELKDWHN